MSAERRSVSTMASAPRSVQPRTSNNQIDQIGLGNSDIGYDPKTARQL